ncbi:hypothetical protein [Rhizobium sp. RU36D]|uniref:hypothetical protein n=1 Tax=Rhizobium sp. RU36D TaxID=1907415 RepID=UPI001FCD28B8|nr:hypothetical protein [Rhizobium sp. RU36D]
MGKLEARIPVLDLRPEASEDALVLLAIGDIEKHHRPIRERTLPALEQVTKITTAPRAIDMKQIDRSIGKMRARFVERQGVDLADTRIVTGSLGLQGVQRRTCTSVAAINDRVDLRGQSV